MQSIYRALQRGNAVAYVPNIFEGYKIIWKKHSTADSWNYAVNNNVTKDYLKQHGKCI